MSNLHAEHLEDLRKSTLTDESIERLHIEDVRPESLKGLGSRYHGVQHAYKIPYFEIDGRLNCYSRLRLFPPIKDEDGHTCKYHQPPQSHPHAYFCPLVDWASIAADPSIPVFFTEGEKKAAAACQAGLACIGIGGLWNWRMKLDNGERLTIPDVDLLVWRERPAGCIPDSETWRQDRQLKALTGFYALGMELVSRGAQVALIKLPEPHGVKVGLDDWLLQHSSDWVHLWPKLEWVGLGDESLNHLACWYQQWSSKHAEAEAAKTKSADQPEEEAIGSTYRFTWPAHQVEMVLERVREERHSVKGELTVSLFKGSQRVSILPNVTTTLTRDKDREDLAKRLKGTNSGTHAQSPWGSIIKVLCERAIARYRTGEPVEMISSTRVEVAPLEDRLGPMVFDRRPTALFSPPDHTKSLFLLFAGMMVEAGVSIGKLSGRRSVPLFRLRSRT